MNRVEHLLTILSEECNEVAQRVSKALRFGLAEKQDGQDRTNAERIVDEYSQLMGVWGMLRDAGILPDPSMLTAITKQARVEHYLKYSEQVGTLVDTPAPPDERTAFYLQHSGISCPFCRTNGVVESDGVFCSDDAIAWQHVRCTTCGQEWDDLYTLTGLRED